MWFRQLRKAVAAAGISETSVRWQRQHHHITAAFINDDGLAEPLAAAFDRLLSSCEPPVLTFDKVDAFMAKDAPVIIVNLTSTKPSPAMMALIQSLRKAASDLGADLDNDFLLHVTLGRIDAKAASAEQVKRIADAIQVPPFTLPLDEAEHRFYRGRSISSWTMGHHHTNHNRNHQNNQTMEKKVIQTSCGEVTNYHTINREVMVDTKEQYETVPALQEAVQHSIGHQYMVAQEEALDQPAAGESHTHYITSARRTFEAAKEYVGKKTTVLNFANNHSVGGAPFSAGAQEESLCRCSTLYPCLQAMYGQFYKKHQDEYGRKEINETGSDDLIYTPDVVVFKTDERTDPQIPRMMEQGEWYKVDVITCAAPDLRHRTRKPKGYEEMIRRRIKKILDVAAKEKAEVLILGAWGCGAFGNDIAVVSKAFYSLLENYSFETVEFALGSTKFFDHFQKGTVVG